jgi:hypothetical protein
VCDDAEPSADDEALSAEEHYRRAAAVHAALAQSFDNLVTAFRHVAAEGVITGPAADEARQHMRDFATGVDGFSQRVKLVGAVSATQAAAIERLREAGGLDDPQALAEHQATVEFYAELMARPEPESGADPA